MKLMQMDLSPAIGFLGLRVVKFDGVTRFLNSAAVEVTAADADQAIAESQEQLALAEQSPLVGGTQYWHWKTISAWTVVKPHLKVEEV
jgi:hypothetical protein